MSSELVTVFVIPNSLLSDDLTKAAKQAARDAVQPVIQEYKAGEIIILRGQIITPADFEALQQFGLIEEASPWQDYIGAGALVIMMAAFINLYFSRRHLPFQFEARSLILVALIFILFIVSARLTIPNRTVLPYAFPLAALGLLIATLFGLETGIVFSIALAILVTYNLPNVLDLTPYYLFSSLTGVLVLGNARRVWTFFRAGMAIAGAGIAMLLAFRFPFVHDGRDRLAAIDGRGDLQRTGSLEHRVVAAILPGANTWPDDCIAIDRDFTSRLSTPAILFAQCTGNLSA